MQKVRIYINKDIAYIKFNYNEDLIDIMHQFNARWSSFDKMWILPKNKATSLFTFLKEEMYDVRMRNIV